MMMLTKRSFDLSRNIRAASIGSPAMLANKKLNINFRIILSCYSVIFTYSSTRNLIAFSCIFLSCDWFFIFFLVSSIWQHLLQCQQIIQLSEDDLSFYIVSVTPSFCCTSPYSAMHFSPIICFLWPWESAQTIYRASPKSSINSCSSGWLFLLNF